MQVAAQRPHPAADLADYLSPLFAECCAHAAHVAVALSGGPDSMALVLLAKDWCDANGKQLTAFTVDHQLRAESAIEARQVASWMRALEIEHIILTPPPMPQIANIQSRARQMRYGALTDQCRKKNIPVLLLAQHFDDQAETVALQKHRGESPPSRAGMAFVAERDGIALARPLLGVRKAQLLALLEARRVPWVEDASNESDFFARNRLRRTLDDAARQRLWRDAQRSGEQRHAQDVTRNTWVEAHARAEGEALWLDLSPWRALDDEERTDLLSRAIQAVGGKEFRPRHYETLRLDGELLSEPDGKATLGHCLISWKGECLRIAPEHSLDTGIAAPHMEGANPLKRLAKPAFWWFNHEPFSTE